MPSIAQLQEPLARVRCKQDLWLDVALHPPESAVCPVRKSNPAIGIDLEVADLRGHTQLGDRRVVPHFPDSNPSLRRPGDRATVVQARAAADPALFPYDLARRIVDVPETDFVVRGPGHQMVRAEAQDAVDRGGVACEYECGGAPNETPDGDLVPAGGRNYLGIIDDLDAGQAS